MKYLLSFLMFCSLLANTSAQVNMADGDFYALQSRVLDFNKNLDAYL